MSTIVKLVPYDGDKQFCEIIINGGKFYDVLAIIKDLPVRDYVKEIRCWIIPHKDIMILIKQLKAINVEVKINAVVKNKYLEYLNWKSEQILIKTSKYDYTKYENEVNSDKRLYPFQVLGSFFLYKSGDGLLCDMVGLGKSVQSLTAVGKHFSDKSINFCIIICPSTLKKNWEQEIKKWSNKTSFVVTGDKNNRRKQYKAAYKYDYMIINYEMLNFDMQLIHDYILSKGYEYALIVDEIQYIKNHLAKRSENTKTISYFAKYSIGMSATAIENSLMDLWSVFQAIDVTVFGSKKLFWHFKDKFIKVDWFGNPIGYKDEETIKKRMSPYLIRRLKEDVLNDLPDRIENNFWVELSPIQRKFYDEVSSQVTTSITDMEKAEKIKYAEILPMITYLRQCVLSAKLVGHSENISTKTTQLLEFLESVDDKSKIVCFTHFVGMVELLKETLDTYKIKNMCIHGKTGSPLFCPVNNRVATIDIFNNDPSCKILVCSDILTEGVNITSANYLLNFDLLFNPAKMEQRVGRIDRIGQKHESINIINFIASDTIDDDIYEKVISKQKISTDIMDNKRIESRISFNDIKSMFELNKKKIK